jgi:peptide/nickel transport system permease protein
MSALDVVEVQTESGIPASAASAEPAGTYQKRKLGFWFWASIVWLAFLLLSAVFADLLPLKDPNETFRGVARQGPGSEHWFGADNIGHDVLARTIYGARRSLVVAGVATTAGILMGASVGLIGGFYRKSIDSTISAVINILLAIPGLVLLLTVISFLAPPGEASASTQTFWVTVALSILVIPTIARVTRAQTMVWGDRDFVMASRTLGARNKRIIVREILPNVVPTLVSFAFTLVAGLIIVEAALAFFGIGDVSGVSWGLMIQNGRSQLERTPHMVLFPALFMFLTIISLNFIGDALRTRFDVREGGI